MMISISSVEARLLELLVAAQRYDSPIRVLIAADGVATPAGATCQAAFELAQRRNSSLEEFYDTALAVGINRERAEAIATNFFSMVSDAMSSVVGCFGTIGRKRLAN